VSTVNHHPCHFGYFAEGCAFIIFFENKENDEEDIFCIICTSLVPPWLCHCTRLEQGCMYFHDESVAVAHK